MTLFIHLYDNCVKKRKEKKQEVFFLVVVVVLEILWNIDKLMWDNIVCTYQCRGSHHLNGHSGSKKRKKLRTYIVLAWM